MAITSELPIYKVAYDLLDAITQPACRAAVAPLARQAAHLDWPVRQGHRVDRSGRQAGWGMAQIRNVVRFVRVTAMTTVRNIDLVVPLATPATAMRTTDTAGLVAQGRSGAVSPLTDRDSRRGDVDSTNKRSAAPVPLGIRISITATRIGTTPTTSAALAPSAAQSTRHHAAVSRALHQ